MRIILTGGGTGGHITPALNIAKKLKEISNSNEILFIGRSGGAENAPITRSNIPLKEIKICGIKRSLSPSNLKRIITALNAVGEAKRIIKEFNPDLILGTGGYVCWPVITAACKMGIPTAIHESNIYPGLVTRILARKCNIIFLNNIETSKYLSPKSNCMQVGNPVEDKLYLKNRNKSRQQLGLKANELLIVSVAGSGGAEAINSAIKDISGDLSSFGKIKLIHSTGRAYYEKWSKIINTNEKIKVVPYIKNMQTYLCAADIVISRCGAMTLSELEAAGVASILIPSPNVTGDHQRKNAEQLSRAGAAIVIEEEALESGALKSWIKKLIEDSGMRHELSEKISEFATPHSADTICKALYSVCGRIK